jgi:type IV secretion system protein VirB10
MTDLALPHVAADADDPAGAPVNPAADAGPTGPAIDSSNANTISPLPGEPGIPDVAMRPRVRWSRKGLLAAGLFMLLAIGVAAYGIRYMAASGKKANEADNKRSGDKPAAASVEPRQLDLPAALATATAPSASPASPSAQPSTRIPALEPTADEAAEPIGVRRTGSRTPAATTTSRSVTPEDAPTLLVTSRPGSPTGQAHGKQADEAGASDPDPSDPMAGASRDLQGYQRQLQGLLNKLTKGASAAAGAGQAGALSGIITPPTGAPAGSPGTVPGPAAGLFGGQLQAFGTPRVAAGMLGNRSLTLPKGTAFTCALKTKVISAVSGLVGCQVQRNVFSDDGRVLLIERGSHLDGEYRIITMRAGTTRIPVLWTRIRTPNGVTVDIDSPGTGQLGESGIDGYVDNRWGERLGAAMLLSLIDDSVRLVIANQQSDAQGNTIVLPATTANTSKLAEKVLDSTINIPPLIYQNQGGIVGIYVARDVDFSSVYELAPVPR